MKMMLVVALMAGCANVNVNRATLAASTAVLVCDWNETRISAQRGWVINGVTGIEENNPIMGRHPSTARVDTYFASAVAINAVLWLVLPQRWRSIAPAAVTAAQVNAIAGNAAQPNGTGVCGF